MTYAIGLFLGVPVIARELERGTVRLAWWLTPSRWRWYLARLLPILVALAVLTFAAGVAADRLFAANNPGLDLSRAFDGYGARGGLLAARAVFIFAVAVFVGSFIGRSLPAVIVATLIAVIGLIGRHATSTRGSWPARPSPSRSTRSRAPASSRATCTSTRGSCCRTARSSATTTSAAADPYDENGNPRYPQVALVIPGERYRFVEAREALVLVVGSLVAMLLAGFVVARRRPG